MNLQSSGPYIGYAKGCIQSQPNSQSLDICSLSKCKVLLEMEVDLFISICKKDMSERLTTTRNVIYRTLDEANVLFKCSVEKYSNYFTKNQNYEHHIMRPIF